jgi:hypothetical protein
MVLVRLLASDWDAAVVEENKVSICPATEEEMSKLDV